VEKAGQIERLTLRLLDDPIQGFTARILENEDRPPLVTSEGERLSRPCRVEIRRQRIFVFEPPETL